MFTTMLRPFQSQISRARLIDQLQTQVSDPEQLHILTQQEERWNRDALITVFSVTTASIHFYYGGALFILDGAGFLVFLAARHLLPQRESYQKYVRDGSILYTALNIIPYFAKYGLYLGFENPIGMVSKLAEMGLIYVQWREGQTAHALSPPSPSGVNSTHERITPPVTQKKIAQAQQQLRDTLLKQIRRTRTGLRSSTTWLTPKQHSGQSQPERPIPLSREEPPAYQQPLPMQEADQRLALSAGLLAVTSLGVIPSLALLNFIAVPGMVYLNLPFARQAWKELVYERRVGVSLIDGLIGFVNLALGFYWIESLFLTIFAINQKYLLKTRQQSMTDILDLFSERHRSVTILVDGCESRRTFDELQVGDLVVVQTGNLIPVDGRVVDGSALVDQHKLTGEARPVEMLPGSQVLANTLLLSGQLTIVVEQTGSDTVVAKIGQLLQRTADHKAALQSKGEAIADRSALPVLGLSTATLFILGPVSAGAILFSSFGYLMRLLSPFSVLNFLRIAAQEGILVKDGRALETLPQVDTVIFDKTGTLTLETLTVVGYHLVQPNLSEDDLLILAAAVEQYQEHPIARAVCRVAHQRQLTLPTVHDAVYAIGLGIQANLDGQLVQVGGERYLETIGIPIPEHLHATVAASHHAGSSLVYVVVDQLLYGAIELNPVLRPEAAQVIAQLQQHKLDVRIVSGDHEEPTRQLAQALGVTTFHAAALPHDKAAIISTLRNQGRTVCFIGDGLNDALALRAADVAVSLHDASSVARDLAQVMLMHQHLSQLPRLFAIAHQLEQNQRNNLIISLLPGALCIPGVYVFNFGVLTAGMLSNLSLLAGMVNITLPMARHRTQTFEDNGDLTATPLSKRPIHV